MNKCDKLALTQASNNEMNINIDMNKCDKEKFMIRFVIRDRATCKLDVTISFLN